MRRVYSGCYETADGRYRVKQEDEPSICESPHPRRTEPGGYCRGGREHWRVYWQVLERCQPGRGPSSGWEKIDAADTKAEAVGMLPPEYLPIPRGRR